MQGNIFADVLLRNNTNIAPASYLSMFNNFNTINLFPAHRIYITYSHCSRAKANLASFELDYFVYIY